VEAADRSETTINLYQSLRGHIPKGRCEDLGVSRLLCDIEWYIYIPPAVTHNLNVNAFYC